MCVSMWIHGCVYLGANANLCVYKPMCECTLLCMSLSECERVFTCVCKCECMCVGVVLGCINACMCICEHMNMGVSL